ncbi:hypothetical protein OU415_02365 [Saccharopolyspora sp. WRP15-2]|uniref:Uncharacterized protein n=1 Tax=Saccharopolyspora oryzae TaxID=2997343 RepID=A0ABT4URB4_9PSEU|nr:hypothetical protein [Saccharopolyspora oryzae]MDA3624261.1 hypothetical protein [Saccharopolyspora oryzae]
MGEIALAALLLLAGLQVVVGVGLLAGLGPALVVSGVLTAVYAVLFLADWPGGEQE